MAKRGNSEGSIYQKKNGVWEGALSAGHVDGKPVRRYFTGKTRQDVAKKLTKAIADRDRGLPVVGAKQTVAEFLENWLETRVKPKVRPRTLEAYASHVRIHLVPQIGTVRLSQLAPQQVQALLNKLVADGLSATTVGRVRATLRAALNDALRWDLVARNAAALASPPPSVRPKVHPLTAQQAQALLRHISGDRLEPLITVALGTGLRMGEILGLQWPEVELDAGTLTVRHALQRIEGHLKLVPPKSATSRRTVPLPEAVIRAFRRQRAQQNRDRLLLGDTWLDTGFVFTTPKGTPSDGSTVTRRFQALVNDAGLPRQRFHDLRHACASFLLAQGVEMYTVKEILGHSQISLTIDTYAHIAPALMQDAARRLDLVLSSDA